VATIVHSMTRIHRSCEEQTTLRHPIIIRRSSAHSGAARRPPSDGLPSQRVDAAHPPTLRVDL
jgi:hypothetical protein